MISFTSLLPIILPGKLCNETLVNFHRNFHINNMPIVIAKQVTLRHQVSHHTISLLQTCASRGLLTTSYKTLKLKKHSLRKIQKPGSAGLLYYYCNILIVIQSTSGQLRMPVHTPQLNVLDNLNRYSFV